MTIQTFTSKLQKQKDRKILIVERDESIRKGLVVAFLDYFSEIRTTGDPYEALSVIVQITPDILLCSSFDDIMDRKEFCKSILTVDEKIKIILTGNCVTDNEKDIERKRKRIIIYDHVNSMGELIDKTISLLD